jgi:arsenite methyltransferase
LIGKARVEEMSEELKAVVRERYGQAAVRAKGGSRGNCCGAGSSCGSDVITRDLYDAVTTAGLPEQAVLASLGCGNPTALAELKEGEVVLDLGSGGGIDVLLSARRVGRSGMAYGLDMTDEMLALARENARKAGAENVEFLKGEIESIPLPDASVDVIISNCVINLSADKRRVLGEAFRVLKPGGRFAVSDVVVRGEVPPEVRRSMELWVGCVAGALEEREFERLLAEVGFEGGQIEPTRIYAPEDASGFLEEAGLDTGALAGIGGRFMAAFVRARKPEMSPESGAEVAGLASPETGGLSTGAGTSPSAAEIASGTPGGASFRPAPPGAAVAGRLVPDGPTDVASDRSTPSAARGCCGPTCCS